MKAVYESVDDVVKVRISANDAKIPKLYSCFPQFVL